MKQNTYIKMVCRRLECSKAKKKEIARQLESDIQSALDNGETLEQVCGRMGTPKNLAAEFNENLTMEEKRQVKRRKRIRIIAVILAVILILGLLIYWVLPKATPIEDSKIFDGEQLEVQAIAVILALNAENYEILQEDYVDDVMKPYMTEEYMEKIKEGFNVNWHETVSFGNPYMIELRQTGKVYATVQITVMYGKDNVTYTISFNPDYKVAGFYIK